MAVPQLWPAWSMATPQMNEATACTMPRSSWQGVHPMRGIVGLDAVEPLLAEQMIVIAHRLAVTRQGGLRRASPDVTQHEIGA